MKVLLIILASALAFALVSGFAVTVIIAVLIFRAIFVRKSADQWSRANSEPGANPDHDAMHALAEEWYNAHRQYAKEISITNDGLRLAGQYLDFGFNRCVIISSGRTEGSVYSTVFAQPYVESGYNILVPDSRAHGHSEGKYVTMGYKEHGDILAWVRYAHEELSCESVVLHGVCVGGATSVYAATDDAAPEYLAAVTVEGLFEDIYEVLRRRIIMRGRKTFPVLQELWLICLAKFGWGFRKLSPSERIATLKKPILFIHSKEDLSSLPEAGERLFEKCGSPNKRIVWTESGSHSHIRLSHREEYDGAIKSFLEDLDHSREIK